MLASSAQILLSAAQPARPVTGGPSVYHKVEPAQGSADATAPSLSASDIERMLQDSLHADELRSLRRKFARLHHPDLVRGAGHEAACRDMATVNMLIDNALAQLVSG